MTKHPVDPEELQAYLDKELVPTRLSEVERHVKDCQECTAVIADLRRVSATLQSWQVETAPTHLKPPVLPVEKPNTGFSWGRLALTLSGAAAVVVIIAAISIPNLLRSRMAANRPPLTTLQGEMYQMGQPRASGAPAEEADVKRILVPTPLQGGRMIAYQVFMTVEVKEFDPAKKQLLQILNAEGGYVAQANFVDTPNQARRANLVLRVPAAKLQTILNQVRALGRVKEEHLKSEEVTEQVVDLEARLHNARATEQRLIEVLSNRTGKVSDILQVEQEIARTREQIERTEAQRLNLMKRVAMATATLTLAEEFKAELQPAPVGTLRQLWNALVDGWDNFSGSVLGIVLFLARYGLTLVLWGGLSWMVWRLLCRPLKRLLTQAG